MLNIHEVVYRLSADPFRLSPDHRFAYSHRSYARSKAYLDYALLQGEGFVMITGAAGTGKTTLIKEILANIDIASVQVATLTSTQLRSRDLLQMVATAFGLRFMEADKATLLTALEQFLRQQCQSGRRAVLIVDEAQGLPVNALEELRLLANLQHDNQMLLQVFLLGQEKLRDLIGSPGLEQLRQRVVASSHLEPLSLDDTAKYVEHRLTQAEWQGDPEISGEALQLIHKYSGGIPRRINLICTRLLLSGGMRKKHALDGQDARDVIHELQQETLIDPDDAEAQMDIPEESTKTEPASGNNILGKERLSEDQSGQPAEASESTEHVADITAAKHQPVSKLSARPGKNRKPPRVSTQKRKIRKRSPDRQGEPLASESSMWKAELEEGSVAQQKKVEEQVVSPDGIGGRWNRGKTGPGPALTNRSISMAAARAAPDPEVRKPDDDPAEPVALSGLAVKTVTSTPGNDGRKPAMKAVKRRGKSLRVLFVIFLLAVGPLIAVVGVNFHDYVITISAQVDKEGVIRMLMPSIGNVEDTGSVVFTDAITDKTSPIIDR